MRVIWALINITIVIVTIFFIIHLWEDYLDEPTIVTLESSNYPIEKVKYPGVSICNLNKISKQRAHEFAEFMFSEQSSTRNLSSELENIKLLGNLYDFDIHGQERFTYFQDVLNKHRHDIDFVPMMIMLAPSCHDVLEKCMWGGKSYPCEELFLTRMTFEGPCCVFNYIRPSGRKTLFNNFRKIPNKSQVPQGPGIENGLEVTLNNKLDDYFYTTMDSVGFNIHIFYHDEFPDVLSGSLMEVLVDAGMHALLYLGVDVIKSTPEMGVLPVNLRKCKFESDDTTIFGPYRQSDCFVDCKIKSMLALCDCAPFTLPVNPKPSEKARVCTLIDIPCLNKHKVKWSRYYPHDADATGLEQEQYDSLSCPNCLPDCNSIDYNVYTNFAPLSSSISKDNNVTVVNIFVNNAFANVYKIDLTNTWFEVLSKRRFGILIPPCEGNKTDLFQALLVECCRC